MINRESTNAQDARLEELWRKLDSSQQGYLDIHGLKTGLRKLDHPLKHASALLEEVMKAMDTNHDGRIYYAEFHSFVKHTEQELWSLFDSIDNNRDGRLDKDELQEAFRRAGVAVSSWKLQQFFAEVDSNHDGTVSFDEWRDFLLFIPASDPNLQQIISYFSSAVKLNAEGDVLLSQETLKGLGTMLHFLKPFFATLIDIAHPPRRPPVPLDRFPPGATGQQSATGLPATGLPSTGLPATGLPATGLPAIGHLGTGQPPTMQLKEERVQKLKRSGLLDPGSAAPKSHVDLDLDLDSKVTPILIDRFPQLGYFLSGGAAGIASRTVTAPLDRLKVYLIAQTDCRQEVIEAAKKGEALQVLRGAWLTASHATRELWAAGGIRSLYAGNGLNVLKVMPESAIRFGTLETIRSFYLSLGFKDNDAFQFLGGGCSGSFAQLIVYPLDTLKFRMQCETVTGGSHGNRLIYETGRKMFKSNGIRAYYRGVTLGCLGMFPYSAIDMGTYKILSRQFVKYNMWRGYEEKDATPGNWQNGMVGAASGALGASLVYPINVIRTRYQSQGTALHPRTYTGVKDVYYKTIEGEGVRGLFRGLTPNLLKVVPSVAISWVVYQNCKSRMKLD